MFYYTNIKLCIFNNKLIIELQVHSVQRLAPEAIESWPSFLRLIYSYSRYSYSYIIKVYYIEGPPKITFLNALDNGQNNEIPTILYYSMDSNT